MTANRISTPRPRGGNHRRVRWAQALAVAVAMLLAVVAALAWPSGFGDAPPQQASAAMDAAGMVPARVLAGEFFVLDGTFSAGR